ncbi:hypothetical protein DV737_g1629, partial [Chaetothyriales sp. CBS 132003]
MSSGSNLIAPDCDLVAKVALSVYRACQTSSSEDFQKMANDVRSLYTVLQDISHDLTNDDTALSHTRADTLKEQLKIAHMALNSLERELQTYDKMSFSTQKKFAALHYGLENAGEAHVQITGAATSLRNLETHLALYSHSSIKKTLIKYLKEIRDGLHEDSVLNFVPDEEIDKKQNWEQFKEELQDLGITLAVLREHRDFINTVIYRAMDSGMLDLADAVEIPDEDPEVASMTTLVNKKFDERVANKSLDIEELRRKEKHVESKKYSPLIALGLRALRIVSDERLIEAADEGDLDQVRHLIRRGANVNASDKWRWTALHMAAYGGFDDIAKQLIHSGAAIDARTVDGETPLNLAEKNRHVAVVRTIEDKVERLRQELGSRETTVTDNSEDSENE